MPNIVPAIAIPSVVFALSININDDKKDINNKITINSIEN